MNDRHETRIPDEEADFDRRNLFKMTGAGVASLGMMSIIGITSVKAQEISNGANNFYTSDRMTSQKVSFESQYQMTVDGNLFTPRNLDRNARHPAVIVAHPMGAVKEQSANLYAANMAEQGFVAMSIDLPFRGESEGQSHNLVLPDVYAEAFSAGVDFLGSQAYVDRQRIGGIGVCGSGSFIICHMATSIDGRLHPSRFTPVAEGISTAVLRGHYEQVGDRFGADGWIVGRKTMSEMSKAPGSG